MPAFKRCFFYAFRLIFKFVLLYLNKIFKFFNLKQSFQNALFYKFSTHLRLAQATFLQLNYFQFSFSTFTCIQICIYIMLIMYCSPIGCNTLLRCTTFVQILCNFLIFSYGSSSTAFSKVYLYLLLILLIFIFFYFLL